MPKPSTEPEWATEVGADIVEPDQAQKEDGWDVQDKPPAGWVNWWWNLVFLWIQWLATKFNDGSTGDRVAVKGLESTAVDANGDGVEGTGDGTGAGVRGTGAGSGGPGVRGVGAGGSGGHGVHGSVTVNTAEGVKGENTDNSGLAVLGENTGTGGGTTGAGVKGLGVDSYGVIAESDVAADPVRSAFRVVPQADTPSSAQSGDLAVDDSGRLVIYNGTTWVTVGLQNGNPWA